MLIGMCKEQKKILHLKIDKRFAFIPDDCVNSGYSTDVNAQFIAWHNSPSRLLTPLNGDHREYSCAHKSDDGIYGIGNDAHNPNRHESTGAKSTDGILQKIK